MSRYNPTPNEVKFLRDAGLSMFEAKAKLTQRKLNEHAIELLTEPDRPVTARELAKVLEYLAGQHRS